MYMNKQKALVFYVPKEIVIRDLPNVKKALEDRGWDYRLINLSDNINLDFRKEQTDIAIVLGGDGSILKVSRVIGNTPILGVNYGKIGYLTEITPSQFQQSLDWFSDERFWIQSIRRLSAEIKGDDKSRKLLPTALNEYLISTSKPSKMLSYEIYLDGEPLTKGMGDGFIVATSIGTTAYALSAGGPVFVDSVDGFLVVPIAPLWGKLRPLVIPGYLTLTIKLLSEGKEAIVVPDGMESYTIGIGEQISIFLSKNETRFIRFGSRYSRLIRLMLIL